MTDGNIDAENDIGMGFPYDGSDESGGIKENLLVDFINKTCLFGNRDEYGRTDGFSVFIFQTCKGLKAPELVVCIKLRRGP